MARRKWKFVKELVRSPRGFVWLVKSASGRLGYFKTPDKKNRYYSGALIANEYIAASLARRLGFPAASLELATVRGRDGLKYRGVVSRRNSARQHITLSAARKKHERLEPVLHRVNLLRQQMVFDTWIFNFDRVIGGNLILYRKNSRSKYYWYLIDHGHALMGSPHKWRFKKWNSPAAQQIRRCVTRPNILHSGLPSLMPMIRKIERLKESDIDRAIRSVPKGYITPRIRKVTKQMLLARQKQLRKMIYQWLGIPLPAAAPIKKRFLVPIKKRAFVPAKPIVKRRPARSVKPVAVKKRAVVRPKPVFYRFRSYTANLRMFFRQT